METQTEEKHLTEQEATAFFAKFYGGEHHIPGFKPERHGFGWMVKHDRGDLATFDFNQLTKLVVLGHDQCIRVSVEGLRKNAVIIAIWKRQGREGGMSLRHPTLEDHVSKIRELYKE